MNGDVDVVKKDAARKDAMTAEDVVKKDAATAEDAVKKDAVANSANADAAAVTVNL